jgi:hypothetical protein
MDPTEELELISDSEAAAELYQIPGAMAIGLSIVYILVSLCAVVGNWMVLWIIIRSSLMKNVTNLFIANLAVADILIGALAIPFQFQAALLQKWLLPHFMCSFCPTVQNVSLNLSIFTLVALSLDRHRAVTQPFKPRITKKTGVFIIIFIWILSVVASMPTLFAFQVVYMPSQEQTSQTEIDSIPHRSKESEALAFQGDSLKSWEKIMQESLSNNFDNTPSSTFHSKQSTSSVLTSASLSTPEFLSNTRNRGTESDKEGILSWDDIPNSLPSSTPIYSDLRKSSSLPSLFTVVSNPAASSSPYSSSLADPLFEERILGSSISVNFKSDQSSRNTGFEGGQKARDEKIELLSPTLVFNSITDNNSTYERKPNSEFPDTSIFGSVLSDSPVSTSHLYPSYEQFKEMVHSLVHKKRVYSDSQARIDKEDTLKKLPNGQQQYEAAQRMVQSRGDATLKPKFERENKSVGNILTDHSPRESQVQQQEYGNLDEITRMMMTMLEKADDNDNSPFQPQEEFLTPICLPDGIPEEYWKLYNHILVTLQYLVPFIIISVTYIHMAIVLSKGSGISNDSRTESERANQSKRRVRRVLHIIIIVVFIVIKRDSLHYKTASEGQRHL